MIEYEVHRALPADWKMIQSVRLRSLADAPDAFGTTLAEDEARPDSEWRARAENDEVAHFLAITPEGEGLGMAVGSPYAGSAESAGLFGMWIAPEARRQNIGRALVESVVAWARHKNYKRILLDVADANSAAIRLYESCGFVPTGKRGTLPPPRDHILEHELSLNLAK